MAALTESLSLNASTLRREVRLRRLRAGKRAGKLYFLGSWVLEWLESGELVRARAHAGNGQASVN
jgi:hypothetical protein